MSKRAEQATLKDYPKEDGKAWHSAFGTLEFDKNAAARKAYQEGYEQAEKEREQMEDGHGKELLYVCQKTTEREHRSGVREGKAQTISHIRNQVKLWMPDNPEGDEYEAGKRLAFASVLQYLKELEAQQGDICSGCTNVKGCVTCVDGNMKEFAEDKDLEKEIEKYYYDNFAFLSSVHIPTLDILTAIAKHFVEWQKQQDRQIKEI